MKFIVDAQLPRRATTWLREAGFDAIHTFNLPDANRSADNRMNQIAIEDERVVITKDADFVDSHTL